MPDSWCPATQYDFCSWYFWATLFDGNSTQIKQKNTRVTWHCHLPMFDQIAAGINFTSIAIHFWLTDKAGYGSQTRHHQLRELTNVFRYHCNTQGRTQIIGSTFSLLAWSKYEKNSWIMCECKNKISCQVCHIPQTNSIQRSCDMVCVSKTFCVAFLAFVLSIISYA